MANPSGLTKAAPWMSEAPVTKFCNSSCNIEMLIIFSRSKVVKEGTCIEVVAGNGEFSQTDSDDIYSNISDDISGNISDGVSDNTTDGNSGDISEDSVGAGVNSAVVGNSDVFASRGFC